VTDFGDDLISGEESSAPAGGIEPLIGDPTKVVTARGTEDGLVLRIDGKADWAIILGDLEALLGGRRRFFEGGEVSVEWLDRLPTKEQSKELEEFLKNSFGMAVASRPKKPPREHASKSGSSRKRMSSEGKTIHLFDELGEGRGGPRTQIKGEDAEGLNWQSLAASGKGDSGSQDDDGFSLGSGAEGARNYVSRIAKMLGDEGFCEEDANARVYFGTLRSGQKFESPYSLVIVGDVNPGADVISGGDIIVFGSLRGTAHAAAYDDDSFDRVIIALHMQPMQLRIGSVISRGSDEIVDGAEIARIENRRILVEAFNPKLLFMRGMRKCAQI